MLGVLFTCYPYRTARSHKKYIMFGALSGTIDKRKGFHILQSALQQLSAHGIGEELEIIVPSTQDTCPQSATEPLACGTPVVAFGATGLLDIVDHKQNGYLAKPFDPEDLAQGIIWVLEDDARRQTLGTNARNRAVEKFDMTKVAKQYTDLYEHVLS